MSHYTPPAVPWASLRNARNPQMTADGRLQHLLTLEGLSRDMLTHILNTAESFLSLNNHDVKCQ